MAIGVPGIKSATSLMSKEFLQGASPVFNEKVVNSLLSKAGVSLPDQASIADLRNRLNEIAEEYYWEEFTPPSRTQRDTSFKFDAVADASVTPSRLNNRLIAIKRTAKRVQAAKSRCPFNVRVADLLDRLGYNSDGTPKRYSGTEKTGHGGSERSAVWLCLVRAVTALERPRQGYRPRLGKRPWASQRLQGAINSLAAFTHAPEEMRAAALDAASAVHSWAEWSTARLKSLITSDPARHNGLVALDSAILKLAAFYWEAFDRKPSLSHRTGLGGQVVPNSWELFLQAALQRILEPEPVPGLAALEARWRRLAYTDRKNRI